MAFRNQEKAESVLGTSKVMYATSTYALLFYLISEAPNLMKLSPDNIRERLKFLQSIFSGIGLGPEVLVAESPRLLTEPTYKIRFWVEGISFLIRTLMTRSSSQISDTAHLSTVSSLILSNPRILVSPASLLVRIPYAVKCLNKPLDPQRLSAFISCNTEDFISLLHSTSSGISQRAHYAHYLKRICESIHEKFPEGCRASLSNFDDFSDENPNHRERTLCGIIGTIAKDDESDLSLVFSEFCNTR